VPRVTGMASTAGTGRVLKHRRVVALAGHHGEFVETARAVKVRYFGVCRGCGAYTRPRNGKGGAYDYSAAIRRDPAPLDPGARARRDARLARLLRPAADVIRLVEHARASTWGDARARLAEGEGPAASVVTRLFGTSSAARAVAAKPAGEMTRERRGSRLGRFVPNRGLRRAL
jgi:hypothetical protein